MFKRNIIYELEKWSDKPVRKPLVIRGARQVGKTTVVRQFSSRFEQFIYLNLELQEDRQPFDQFSSLETLLQALFFIKNQRLDKRAGTLLFIDEIQEVPGALAMLRYFYEQAPDLHVIAAGSMLETLFNQKVSFPVGRVEYLAIYPVSFPEFLAAIGEDSALEQLSNIPVASFAQGKLLQLFHQYALIGGMPEIVQRYAAQKDLTALSGVYESLIVSYMDDVEKYAPNQTQVQLIRHAITASYAEAGKRIKFQGFGKSNYGSREMGEALRTLEKALLIHLIFPQTRATLPLEPDYKRSPRLQVLDTGMLNYALGIQKEIIGTKDLSAVYQGTVIEHLVGQELLAKQYSALHGLNFWVREKTTANAEVDYIYPYDGKLIPVEVKSGKEGTLRSLHVYMDIAPHDMAVRLYAGDVHVSTIDTEAGKRYYLLNLPYYLVSQLEAYLRWFEAHIRKEA
jgi:predicted AAA+ superfamily ATPase